MTIVARLRGGPFDGRVMTVSDTDTLSVVKPERLPSFDLDPDPTRPSLTIGRYDKVGLIAQGNVYVFEWQGWQ